jgi:hypothetical protein
MLMYIIASYQRQPTPHKKKRGMADDEQSRKHSKQLIEAIVDHSSDVIKICLNLLTLEDARLIRSSLDKEEGQGRNPFSLTLVDSNFSSDQPCRSFSDLVEVLFKGTGFWMNNVRKLHLTSISLDPEDLDVLIGFGETPKPSIFDTTFDYVKSLGGWIKQPRPTCWKKLEVLRIRAVEIRGSTSTTQLGMDRFLRSFLIEDTKLKSLKLDKMWSVMSHNRSDKFSIDIIQSISSDHVFPSIEQLLLHVEYKSDIYLTPYLSRMEMVYPNLCSLVFNDCTRNRYKSTLELFKVLPRLPKLSFLALCVEENNHSDIPLHALSGALMLSSALGQRLKSLGVFGFSLVTSDGLNAFLVALKQMRLESLHFNLMGGSSKPLATRLIQSLGDLNFLQDLYVRFSDLEESTYQELIPYALEATKTHRTLRHVRLGQEDSDVEPRMNAHFKRLHFRGNQVLVILCAPRILARVVCDECLIQLLPVELIRKLKVFISL